MKKTILSTILLSGLFLGSVVVSAETDPADKDKNRHAETDVNVTLKEKGPDIEDGPFSGSLAFVYRPTAYNFSGKVSNTTGSKINLVNQQVDYEKNIVVNDDRRDNSDNVIDSNWSLSAGFELTGDKDKQLKGAVLTLTPSEKAYLYDIGDKFVVKDGIRDIEPNPAPKEIVGEELAGVTTKTAKLPAGEAAQTLVSSERKVTETTNSPKDRGAFVNLGNANLSVASDNGAGSYTGKVVWSLSSSYNGTAGE